MSTTNAAIQATLQKIFVLAAGMPADTQVAASLAQQVQASGNWNAVRALVDGYLAGQAQAIGAAALLKQMALQGLNHQLSDADANAFAQQIASGALSWSQLVLNVIELGGPLGQALANKAEAAEAFTQALLVQGKGSLYFGGAQLMDGVRELLLGVTAQHSSVAEARDSLQALVDHLGSAGISVKVADGYLQGATVFVDADGDGRLDAGEQVLQADAAGQVTVGSNAAGAGLVALGGVDLLTGCDFEGVVSAPAGATVVNALTTLVDALMRNGIVASAQAGSDFVEQEFGLAASLNLLNYDPLAVLANPLASAADRADALAAQALSLQVLNVITLGGLQLSEVGGVDVQQASRLMTDALAKAMAANGALDLGDAGVVQGIIQGALQALTGQAPGSGQAQDAGRIAQIVAALNDEADASGSIYQLAKVAKVSQCGAVDAVRDALAAGSGLQGVADQYTGQNLLNAILLAPVTGEVAPGVPVREVVLPIQTVAIVSVADDRGTESTADDIAIPRGGLSGDATPLIRGNVSAPLQPGEAVAVYGGPTGEQLLGTAAVSGQNWSFTPPNPLSAQQQFVARVVNFHGEGPASDAYPVLFNLPPEITSDGGGASASVGVAEGATAVTTVTASDVNGDTLGYSIVGGADAARFTIDAATGVLRFVSAPDFEAPADAGSDNVYDVVVQVSDGMAADTQAIAVRVTNVNETPVITSDGGGASAPVTVAENTNAVTTVAATDVDGDGVSYSIVGGADAARFTIDASTGALGFVTAPDFETPLGGGTSNVYDVVVQASDGSLSDTQQIVVTVVDVNEAPVITSNGGGASAAVSIAENTTAVTTVSATDQDGGSLSYSIAGGADAARFTIDASTGALSFITAPDREAPTDAGTNNVYDVVVQVSDGALTDTQAIAVLVNNVNEPPAITSNGGGASAGVSVAENTTAVTTVTATDVDGNSLSYSIVGGADSGLFTINATTGALSFITAPNYEAPVGCDNNYDVVVQVSDGTLTDTQALFVTVTNVNEAPVITSGGGGASASVSVAENGTAVTTIAATDQDGNALTYSIAGGADAARFTIDAATGAVSFITAPDFENPVDANANNVYLFQVAVSDGTLMDLQSVAVTVTNANEAPAITSNGGGASAGVSVAENTTAVTTVAATDVDGNPVTYTIVGGTDADKFAINTSTGALSFNTAPDYETPLGGGTTNVYEVVVQATDGTLTDTQTLYVNVTDANDAPRITSNGGGASAGISVAENSTAVTTVTATDQDGHGLTYSIVAGSDMARFTIDAATGALSFITAPDFESPNDIGFDNVYNVTVRVSDGTLADVQALSVTVTNVNEAPAITSNGGGASAGVSVAENTTAVTTVTATDVDGNSLAYSIAGGADSGLFTIDAATGALSFITAPNYEAPVGCDNNYDVVVQVSDGTLTDTQTLFVTVTNANEAPVITSDDGGESAGVGVAENTTAVTTVSAGDIDGDSVAYSITGGADAALFTIDASTGALSFTTAPDYESPLDADANNLYEVTVTASDGTLADTQTLYVQVDGVNEAPVVTGGATVSVDENTTAVTTVSAVDPDGDSVSYSIVGGGDSALFTIDGSTGALSFITAPDFENPLDTDGNNVYFVHVEVNDGALGSLHPITVTVTNANEAPVITGGASTYVSVADGTTAVTTVAATDVDGDSLSYSIVGGADAALFTIDAGTGALSFITAPNHAAPADAGANNVYDVTVSASDGTLADTQDIGVVVYPTNNAPVITSYSAGATAWRNVAENSLAVGTVTATDADGNAITYSISGGADSSLFTVDATTGALSFLTAPDFENPQDAGADNVYNVTVRASDGIGSDTQAFVITVTNVNETPVITSNGGGSTASVTVAENTTAVTTVAATDAEGSSLNYTIVGGADAARFTIDAATGALSFITAPNFEAPNDAGANNVYDVVVQASDGTFADTQALAVTVTNANEAPVITSGGGGASAVVGMVENSTSAGTLAATDPDGNTVSYSIVGGPDAALFTINASTGALSFIIAPDFENPMDAGANNVYNLTVQASDGTLTDTQALAITVNNLNEAPVITTGGGAASVAVTVSENTTSVGTVTATDVDGNSLAYSISGGADSARFTINSSTGALSFITAPNFESPADAGANNVYDVTVRVSDGTLTDTQDIAVTVSNAAEAPSVLGDNVIYSGASAASTAFLPRLALFNNDSGETAKSSWSLTNITNTAGGGTASASGDDLSLSGFDTATSDTFTYQATDATGTSGTATVTVTRVGTTGISGTNGADVILGSNMAGVLIGNQGNDYILGGTGNDTITGGMDADNMTGGAGSDVYVFAEGSSGVGPTAVSFAVGNATQVDDGDTFTFANGVDVIRGFTSGSDKLDLDKSTAPTSLNGVSITTSLGNNSNYTLVGSYNEVTRVFTANSSGSDLMVIQGGNQAPNAFVSSENDFIILVGVTAITGGGGPGTDII